MSRLRRSQRVAETSAVMAEVAAGLIQIFPTHFLTETITAVD